MKNIWNTIINLVQFYSVFSITPNSFYELRLFGTKMYTENQCNTQNTVFNLLTTI